MSRLKVSKISSPPRLLPRLNTPCLSWSSLSPTGYTTQRQRKESFSHRITVPLGWIHVTLDPKTYQFGSNSTMESWLISQVSPPTSSICSPSQNPTIMTSTNGSSQIKIPLPPLTLSGHTFIWSLRTPIEEAVNP